MSIRVQRFGAAAEFLDSAGPFLLRNEAHHNLILGLAGTLEVRPEMYGEEQPYLAAALSGDTVVAVALMTPPRPLVLSLCEDDAVLQALVADVHAFREETAGVNGPEPASRRFAEAWQRLTREAFSVQLAERCYRLNRVRWPQGVSGQAREAVEADLLLIAEWRHAFTQEAVPFESSSVEEQEGYARRQLASPRERFGLLLWEDGGVPVSMATYSGATPNSLRIGGVYTPPAHRGRGYASACTAAVSQRILDLGKSFATLYTDLKNPTSNHIYQEIGYKPVCDATLYMFERR
jgi:hypothetical protein